MMLNIATLLLVSLSSVGAFAPNMFGVRLQVSDYQSKECFIPWQPRAKNFCVRDSDELV